MHPLVAEAMKKAAIVWLAVGGAPAYPVWCLGLDDALYVVTGADEQPTPGVDVGTTVEVSARGDHGGRIVSWAASAHRILPDSEEWATVAPQLAAKRLNAPGTSEALVARWAEHGAIYRLAPVGDEAATGASSDAPSGAAPPPPTPASRRTAVPFHLHKVKRR
jgi:hypothetical protein